jgi:hypothetical protein
MIELEEVLRCLETISMTPNEFLSQRRNEFITVKNFIQKTTGDQHDTGRSESLNRNRQLGHTA